MSDSVIHPSPTPSNSSGYLRSLYDGAVRGDYSSNDSSTKTAAQIAVGLIPVAGQLADFRDTSAAVRDLKAGKDGSLNRLLFAGIGWIPGIGDFIKSARKVGLRQTVSALRDSVSSLRSTWSQLWKSNDERIGEVGILSYKPGQLLESEDVPFGALGVTNRYGDIRIAEGLNESTQKSTLDHELVHSFFSPKLLFGQEFRANVGLLGYLESHLLRRTEEGLAEAWARFQKDGFGGILEGWNFPLTRDYGIDPERLKIERNLLLGTSTSILAAGSAIGDSLAEGSPGTAPASRTVQNER